MIDSPQIHVIKNIKLLSKHANKPFGLDIYQSASQEPKPILVFVHGFKGFKDWGHFPAVARYFAANEMVFVKFNFSHNGTSYEQPTDFIDLQAFGQNNFTKELDDLGLVVDYVSSDKFLEHAPTARQQQLYLMGFSRGGGVSIIYAAHDARVKKLVTWSAVSDMVNYWPAEVVEVWEQQGVITTPNARTGQEMPLYYQLYQDLQQNAQKYDIGKAAGMLQIPYLIIHGSHDETLPIQMAYELKEKNPRALLHIIQGAGHTYGGYHPFNQSFLPEYTRQACDLTLQFLQHN